MKNMLLLLLITIALVPAAIGQFATGPASQAASLPAGKSAGAALMASRGKSAARTTGQGYRIYNWVDALAVGYIGIYDNMAFPYLWKDYNSIWPHTSGYDTVGFSSFGQVFHPWFPGWDNIFSPQLYRIYDYTPYRVDTVKVYGLYIRNPLKPTVVDTMRITAFYGNGDTNSSIVRRVETGPIISNYNVSALNYATVRFDTTRTTAKAGVSGSTVTVKDVLLYHTGNDTAESGMNVIRAAVNMNVPAGNYAGMTATFISGDPDFVPYDTVIVNGAITYPRYSHFRPSMFEHGPNGLPLYFPDSNYNTSLLKFKPLTATGPVPDSRNWYTPDYFLPNGGGAMTANVDFVISSPGWVSQSVGSSALALQSHSAYPNPASGSVTISCAFSTAAAATVQLVNASGQVVKSATPAPAAEVQHTFSVADLPAGVYTYIITAAGQRTSGRMAVIR